MPMTTACVATVVEPIHWSLKDMISIPNSALCALVTAAALVTPLALAQDKTAATAGNQKQAGIDEIDCRTLLRLSGEERSYTILYLHGYVSGRKGQAPLPAQQLALATDIVIDQCIDRPWDKLLPVFERVRAN